jgi:5'(3')-deoxyribonucleotidase
VPQLVTMKNHGRTELSPAMLAIYLSGLGLWLIYGLMIGAVPVIVANAASIIIVSAVTFRTVAAARGKAVAESPASDAAHRRLRIAIDMDEVMADALTEHMRRYNAAFGEQLTSAELRGRHLEDWIPPTRRAAVEAMLDASFFADLAVMPDCEEVIRELASRHDVFIVSAAMDVPSSFDAKFRWLQQHFPFLPPAQIVFCGDKSVIDADYLIDDRARHFARFKGRPLLFSAPHNAGESRYPRVDSWPDVRAVFAQLEGQSTGAARDCAPLRDEPAVA